MIFKYEKIEFMQTRALKTLVKIAHFESFATAADQLNMTLSTVSMQMKTLERDLGVLLFDRSFRPPKLTPVGRSVARRAEDVLAAEEALIDVCRPSDRLTGSFRVGFVSTASVRLLPNFLKRAKRLAPGARFDLETGLSHFLEQKILDGLLDAAVVTASEQADPQLRYDVLRHERLVYAAPVSAKGRSLEALVSELPFLQFAPTTGIGKLIMRQLSGYRDLDRRRIHVLDSVESIVECVKAGIGFTLLQEPDIRRYADEQVEIFAAENAEIARQLVLATLRGGSAERQRDLLKELLVE